MEHKLIIFDIDGTLSDTCDVDGECFARVAEQILGKETSRYDWRSSPHMTDQGILNWLWEEIKGYPPTRAEVNNFRHEFKLALEAEFRHAPDRFKEIPGARNIVSLLPSSGWNVAIATGGWRSTALLKIGAVGLQKDLLLSSSDDSYDRAEIFRLAWRRSIEERGRDYDRIVLAGDGVWDVHVASDMRWNFIGIGNGKHARMLIDSGVSAVLPDYLDSEEFVKRIALCGE